MVGSLRRQLLLGTEPEAVLARTAAISLAAQCCRLVVAVLVDISCLGITVVVTGAIFPWQAIDRRAPDQLDRDHRALGAAAAELEAIATVQVRRVLLVGADLRVELGREVVFDPQGPLADWPVVPDVAGPVADLGAAEGQVLEVAGEAVEVFTLTEAAEFHIQRAIEVFLLDPHLGQPPGLATTPDFLGRGEAADPWIIDAVVADVVAVALGDGELELGVVPAEDLLQVQVRAEGELAAVACRLVVVITAVQVSAHFAGVTEGEVVAAFSQLRAGAAPIAEHPWRVTGEHRSRLGSRCQAGDGQTRKQRSGGGGKA
ncbi:hypothetical protein D3C72_1318000 [compost metagenome]